MLGIKGETCSQACILIVKSTELNQRIQPATTSIILELLLLQTVAIISILGTSRLATTLLRFQI